MLVMLSQEGARAYKTKEGRMDEGLRKPWYYRSRCQLGKKRAYWVVIELGEDALVAEGYCTTVEEAERAARSACPEARTTTNRTAQHFPKLKVHEKRLANPKGPGGAEVRRFVYALHTSDYDGQDYWVAYPIKKVTAQRLFIGRDSKLVGGEDRLARPYDPLEECASLDRAEFERRGEVYCHKWREFFYRELPGPSRSAPNAVIERALSVLGLAWPATPDEIRAAYRRRSLVAHPDTGGTDDEFRRVHEAYELCAAT